MYLNVIINGQGSLMFDIKNVTGIYCQWYSVVKIIINSIVHAKSWIIINANQVLFWQAVAKIYLGDKKIVIVTKKKKFCDILWVGCMLLRP